MKRFFQSEAGAIVLWILSSILLAAVIAPWIYQGGKALAAAAGTRELPGILEWLGAACGRSKFGRFFSRGLSFSALVFLPLLYRRIRVLAASRGPGKSAWVKVGWKSALIQIAVGCLIAGSILWGLAMVLHAVGAYTTDPHPPKPGKLLMEILMPAVAAPLVEESVFRGLLLGLWMKSARPLAACVSTSLMFAFLHFLDPPKGFEIADPGAPFAGFELMGTILFHFANPLFFVTDFATLFVVGMFLAWARLRTGALWFSIGLHAGWIIAFKSCNLLYIEVLDHPLRPWGVGENLRSGLLPMLSLVITALICHSVMQRFDVRRQTL